MAFAQAMSILKNVPPPQGSKAGAAPYQRFIPREEVGQASPWNLGSFAAGETGGFDPAEPAPAATSPQVDESEWLARLAQARQQALQEGYQNGYRDGLAALEGFKQSFAAQATAQIGALLDAFDAQTRSLDAELAQAVTRTALQLARQVLRHELATQPELVATIATDAVNAVLLSARHVVVHAHPADLPLIEEGAGDTLRARHARLVSDATVARGGVKLESDVGLIDAQIATRWAQAAAQLGAAREEMRFDAAPAPAGARA
jgi:flagellar assembly protein FliH